jgi:acetyl-CoA C-acetyltransferase
MGRTDAIRDKVAIVGMGCCKFGENWDKDPQDMIVEAAYEAYEDAGIDDPQKRIEAVFCGAQYPSKGSAEVADALKLFDRPVTMVVNYCATGTDAFRCAVFSVACGMYDTVLVVGFDKPKDRGVSGPSVAVTGVRGLPATPAGLVLAVRRAVLRDLRRRAGRSRADRGQESPQRHARPEVDAEARDHDRGRAERARDLVAVRPLRLRRAVRRRRRRDHHPPRAREGLPCRPDPGACDWHRARAESAGDPSFDFLRWKASEMAAKQVYAQAGITNPRKEIHVAQVHDCFTLTELLAYEDLGFCEKGSAKDHIKSGAFELGGDLPVNTDGGLKTFGHPTGATGVRMIYENYKQLQGKAEKRQVKNPTVALSHNIGGAPQACGICIIATP